MHTSLTIFLNYKPGIIQDQKIKPVPNIDERGVGGPRASAF